MVVADLFFLAEHGAESAYRKQSDGIFRTGFLGFSSDNFRTHADGKFQNSHSAASGRDKMAKLVDKDHQRKEQNRNKYARKAHDYPFLTPRKLISGACGNCIIRLIV
ncbi:hypothetical protein SDC9_119999 [bioreactor metagenome]|uniref:Uncharacterized protein n=1 Tax=bioreactor metagenome TaxID=1076179 RepID=A0A645C912_9ZZZZ